jgi:hypothetical protein
MDADTMRALEIVGYYVAVYVLSALFSTLTIGPVVRGLVRSSLKESPDPAESRLANYVGILERVMYTTSMLIGKPEFIGVWLVVKVVQQRRSREHNVFLVGSALSLIWGVGTAFFIREFLPPFPFLPSWRFPTT